MGNMLNYHIGKLADFRFNYNGKVSTSGYCYVKVKINLDGLKKNKPKFIDNYYDMLFDEILLKMYSLFTKDGYWNSLNLDYAILYHAMKNVLDNKI
jgi:hypothetical protein